ncbi:MAG: hypothetical protein ACREU7_07135 [Burkholderiales bacterium]
MQQLASFDRALTGLGLGLAPMGQGSSQCAASPTISQQAVAATSGWAQKTARRIRAALLPARVIPSVLLDADSSISIVLYQIFPSRRGEKKPLLSF